MSVMGNEREDRGLDKGELFSTVCLYHILPNVEVKDIISLCGLCLII